MNGGLSGRGNGYNPADYGRGTVNEEHGTGLRAEKNPVPAIRVFPDPSRPEWGILLAYSGVSGGEQDEGFFDLFYRGAIRWPDAGEIKVIFQDWLVRIEGAGEGFESVRAQIAKHVLPSLRKGESTPNALQPFTIKAIRISPLVVEQPDGLTPG